MQKQNREFRGKSVAEAIEQGLSELGLRKDQVRVEVINEGNKGLFGIGAVDARVLLIPIGMDKDSSAAPAPVEAVVPTALSEESAVKAASAGTASEAASLYSPELVEMASASLRTILEYIGFDVSIDNYVDDGIDVDPDNPPLVLDVQGKDLGALIGRQSETLRALEYLVRLIVNQRVKHWVSINVDVESYRKRRRESLQRLALRLAKQVVESGRPVKMEAMPSSERRIVHLTLRDYPGVYTESVGEHPRRRVTILPTPKS